MSDKNNTTERNTQISSVKFSVFHSIFYPKATPQLFSLPEIVQEIRNPKNIPFDANKFYTDNNKRLKKDGLKPFDKYEFRFLLDGCIEDGMLSVKWVNNRIKTLSRTFVEYPKHNTTAFKKRNLGTLKSMLPAIMFGGSANKRSNEAIKDNFTGLVQIDYDLKEIAGNEKVLEKKIELEHDKHILLIAVSPSGYGLKAIVHTNQPFENYNAVKSSLAAYFKSNYDIEIDQAVSASGAPFMPYDANVYFNPDAISFDEITETKSETKRTGKTIAGSNDLKSLLDAIHKDKIDLTANYQDWVNIGLAIARAYKDDGIELFQQFSQYNKGYSDKATKAKYKSLFKSNANDKSVTLGTIFHLADQAGLEYTKPNGSYIDVLDPDTTIQVQTRISEASPELAKLITEKKNVLIQAPTGSGKTYAIIQNIAPIIKGKTLIVQPLIATVEQISEQYKIPSLTGSSDTTDFNHVTGSSAAVCTFDQAPALIPYFDNIVVDEAHNYTSAFGYRAQALNELSEALPEDKNVIFITATPTNLFKQLGAHIIQVNVTDDDPININVIETSAKTTLQTLLQHVREHESKGVSLIKINSKKVMKAAKNHLLKNGYQDNEILLLYSDESIKAGDGYQLLKNDGLFADSVKIVIATNLINDGLNILDPRVKQVVNIENTYYPDPADLVQFLARVRNKTDVMYYSYHKTIKKARKYVYFNPDEYYTKQFALTNEIAGAVNKYGDEEQQKTLFRRSAVSISHRLINTETGWKVNKLSLMYDVRMSEINNMSLESFYNYIQLNYNITNTKTTIEAPEPGNEISGAIETERDNEKKAQRATFDLLKNHTDLLLAAIYTIIQDRAIRKAIKQLLPLVSSKLSGASESIVMDNPTLFADYLNVVKLAVNRYLKLIETGLQPNEAISIIFDDDGHFNSNEKYSNIVTAIDTHLLNESAGNGSNVNKYEYIHLQNTIKILLNASGWMTGASVFKLVNGSRFLSNQRNSVKFIQFMFEVETKTINGTKYFKIGEQKTAQKHLTFLKINSEKLLQKYQESESVNSSLSDCYDSKTGDFVK